MNDKTDNEESIRADMIAGALALLSIIEADRTGEDADESPAAREARLHARATARRLVAEIIAVLQAPGRGAMPNWAPPAVA
jgi:hypothetical protein